MSLNMLSVTARMVDIGVTTTFCTEPMYRSASAPTIDGSPLVLMLLPTTMV